MKAWQNLKNTSIFLTATLPTLGGCERHASEDAKLSEQPLASAPLEPTAPFYEREKRGSPLAFPPLEPESTVAAPQPEKGKAWGDYTGIELAFAISALNRIEQLASSQREKSGAHKILMQAKENLSLSIKADDTESVINHGVEARLNIRSLFLMLSRGTLGQEYQKDVFFIDESLNGMLRPFLDRRMEGY